MRRRVTRAAATLAAVGLIAPASAAAAGWSSVSAVQAGTDPILSFSPTGAAVIGSELAGRGRATGADIDIAPVGQGFAPSPFTLTAPSAGHGPEALSAVALSSGGYLAASFANPTRPAPVLARVAPPAPSQFAKLQQLVPVGDNSTAVPTPDSFSFAATTGGELIGAGTDDAGNVYTASLVAKGTHFSVSHGLKGFTATDAYALATDTSGNVFLAGDGPNGCSAVAFRPAHGHFIRTYATGNCASNTPNIFGAITATSHGYAGLLSEDVSESGLQPTRLLAQVGRNGHFSQAVQLSGNLGESVQLASDADGELTASWSNCQSGELVDGRLAQIDCGVAATTGSVTRGFSTNTSTLAVAQPGVALRVLTADRSVALSRCTQPTHCSFAVFTARPGGGFRPAHRLGTGRTLVALAGDDHGNLLAVWSTSDGRVWAATGSAATGRWSTDRRLSGAGIDPATVTAAYGPKRSAIVAWSAGNRTYATRFTL